MKSHKKDPNCASAMCSAGSIHWLLPKDRIPSEHLLAAPEIDDGCLDHPVLILAANAARKEVAILIVRISFDRLSHMV